MINLQNVLQAVKTKFTKRDQDIANNLKGIVEDSNAQIRELREQLDNLVESYLDLNDESVNKLVQSIEQQISITRDKIHEVERQAHKLDKTYHLLEDALEEVKQND